MVIALAGRRIDPSDATVKRFPAENAQSVKQKIHDFLQAHPVHALVCAAACGADILALEAAGELGLRRCIVLPFDKATFRHSSVVDRGEEWGHRYDSIIAEVELQGDLSEGAHDKNDEQTYLTGNLDILSRACSIAEDLGVQPVAMIVWNGESRGNGDVTAHFKEVSQQWGMDTKEIITL